MAGEGRSLEGRPPEREQSVRGSAAFHPLWFTRYVVRLRPQAILTLPVHGRGAIFRGGFALKFRQSVCHDMSLECRGCLLYSSCTYPEVFEPAPPAGGDRLSTFRDLPRPFVIDPPGDARTLFDRDDALDLGITVVGETRRHLPLFLEALQLLADAGLGRQRIPLIVESVTAIGPAGRASLALDGQVVRAANLMQAGDDERTTVGLRFVTPTDLKDAGRPLTHASFGALARRLRDRMCALAAFFGDRPLELDFKGVSALGDAVRVVADETRRLAVPRTSQRTGQSHDIGGLVGEARFEGEAIGPLMPLVRWGEALHVGKHAAFGNGRIEVIG